MASVSLLRYSPLPKHYHVSDQTSPALSFPSSTSFSFQNLSFNPLCTKLLHPTNHFQLSSSAGDGNNGAGHGRNGGDGGHDGSGWSEDGNGGSDHSWGILGMFLNGWRSRVAADPQFPFKVLMEELVGVSSNVLGDMASRPNFGLNELDFVFSTLVVGFIVNFTLMYLLAPTMSTSASSSLPAIFANCPKSHMFESGAYSFLHRFGTFLYKGAAFAAVGFAAGLAGTALSNGLIKMKKKMDPNFETPNKPPPTILNASTWAIHMGLSSNVRYQSLNGLEFVLEKGLSPLAFKSSVVVLRCLNNVLGGMTFVMLARLTGSQSVVEEGKTGSEEGESFAEEEEKLVNGGADLSSGHSASK